MPLTGRVGGIARRLTRRFGSSRWRHRVRSLTPWGDGLTLEAGSPTDDELDFLRELVHRSREHPGPIVEIGTLIGRTVIEIAIAKSAEQRIITVDNFEWNPWGLSREQHRDLAATVLRFLTNTGQVEIVDMDKNEFYERYDGPPPALVFLDAVHSYDETKLDITWARRVGAAMICGHDYEDSFPGLMQLVDECGGPVERRGALYLLAASA